jgi:hypothetical protein
VLRERHSLQPCMMSHIGPTMLTSCSRYLVAQPALYRAAKGDLQISLGRDVSGLGLC